MAWDGKEGQALRPGYLENTASPAGQRVTIVLVELVQITTCDGLRLDGVFHEPVTKAGASAGIDALCLVHGTGGNFYSSPLFARIAAPPGPMGVASLRINTRGHDGISTAATASGGRRLGAAFEIVD